MAIHLSYIIISCYTGIMLNTFSDPLCSILCWHNRQVNTNNPKSMHAMIGTERSAVHDGIETRDRVIMRL